MNYCSIHSHKTGKRCSKNRDHKGRHDFDQCCICGIAYCIGRNKRIIKNVQRKVVAV